MKAINIILIPLAFAALSCSVKPDPIRYGEDNCHECQMTIMDRRYGTEAVTAKGKAYKFDSVECLLEFLEENESSGEALSLVLITPFDQPGMLADAQESHVLHSRELPSPMGLYLTAFASETAALEYKNQHGGKVYCWDGLRENFKVIRALGR